ncbi:MAG: EamA family transporter RarD [Pseudomonadota bacterium]
MEAIEKFGCAGGAISAKIVAMKNVTPSGLAFAMAAILTWGFFPIYFKMLESYGAMAVISHRMIWAVLVIAVLLTFLGQWPAVLAALRSRRAMKLLFFSTLSMGFSWGFYIWAVHNGRIVEASMGYYLTPLMSVVVGLMIFRERLSPLQIWAVGLAATGVGVSLAWSGIFPWIGVLLGGTFAIYSGVRKLAPVDALAGVFIESLFLLPFGIALALWDGVGGGLAMNWVDLLLLASGGLVTILPITWYVAASRRMPLSTLGTLFYIAPTMGFLSGVFVFGEPFTFSDGIMFALIWLGLILFSLEGTVGAKQRRLAE